MKILLFLAVLIASNIYAEPKFIDKKTEEKAKASLVKKHGEKQLFRIEHGIRKSANFWKEEDGGKNDFIKFCEDKFISDPAVLEANFKAIERNLEFLNSSFSSIRLEMSKPIDEEMPNVTEADNIFTGFSSLSYLSEEYFNTKVAFFILLNFPSYSLEERVKLEKTWTSLESAYAILGKSFISRIPKKVLFQETQTYNEASNYINNYNIFTGSIVDKAGKPVFQNNLKLSSHWGLRDEIKAEYSDPQLIEKQRLIYKIMLRIINQEIPKQLINSDKYQWNPITNKLYKDSKEVKIQDEFITRYSKMLKVINATKELDKYYPAYPTAMDRAFKLDKELSATDIKELLLSFLSSPQIKKVAELIQKRLGRRLEPFDLWYDGFKSKETTATPEKLDSIVSKKYPTVESLQKDIPNLLVKLGFSTEQAALIEKHTKIDISKDSGSTTEASSRTGQNHIRIRFPKTGLNFHGFKTFIHELGHSAEETFSMHKPPYYMLTGIPNHSFSETFAYLFEYRDMELLGQETKNEKTKYSDMLNIFWATYAFAGGALVDMEIWEFLYQHPMTTEEGLKKAVIGISDRIWNDYYSEILNSKNQPVLSIYSHIISSPLYFANYPLGHIVLAQFEKYMDGKNLGKEMERICSKGSVTSQYWMENAVGSKISVKPLLDAADEALRKL